MDLSEEEVHQNRESPEEHIVHPVCHGVLLLVFDLVGHVFVNLWFFRHVAEMRSIDGEREAQKVKGSRTVLRRERG